MHRIIPFWLSFSLPIKRNFEKGNIVWQKDHFKIHLEICRAALLKIHSIHTRRKQNWLESLRLRTICRFFSWQFCSNWQILFSIMVLIKLRPLRWSPGRLLKIPVNALQFTEITKSNTAIVGTFSLSVSFRIFTCLNLDFVTPYLNTILMILLISSSIWGNTLCLCTQYLSFMCFV